MTWRRDVVARLADHLRRMESRVHAKAEHGVLSRTECWGGPLIVLGFGMGGPGARNLFRIMKGCRCVAFPCRKPSSMLFQAALVNHGNTQGGAALILGSILHLRGRTVFPERALRMFSFLIAHDKGMGRWLELTT